MKIITSKLCVHCKKPYKHRSFPLRKCQSPRFCCFQRACNKSKAERPPTTDQNSFTSPVGQLRNIDLQVASRTEADSVLPRYRGRGRFRNLAASCQARNRSSKLGFTGFTVQMDSHLQSSKHGQRIRLTLANELLHLVTRRSFGHFSLYFWRSRHGSAVQPLLYSMQFLRFSSWIINRSVQYARDLGSTLKLVVRCSCFLCSHWTVFAGVCFG